MAVQWYMQKRNWLIVAGGITAGALLALCESPSDETPSVLAQTMTKPDGGTAPSAPAPEPRHPSPDAGVPSGKTITETRLAQMRQAYSRLEAIEKGREGAERALIARANRECNEKLDQKYPQLKGRNPVIEGNQDPVISELWGQRSEKYNTCTEDILDPDRHSPEVLAAREKAEAFDRIGVDRFEELKDLLLGQQPAWEALQNDGETIPDDLLGKRTERADEAASLVMTRIHVLSCNLAGNPAFTAAGFRGDPGYEEKCQGVSTFETPIHDQEGIYATAGRMCRDLLTLMPDAEKVLSMALGMCGSRPRKLCRRYPDWETETTSIRTLYFPACTEILAGPQGPAATP
ncbi:MAG: hypothetical protein M3O22_08055 [Pseudomonadota bacterium]|nr:hypothetical protein [Pseudomonadota bacterium]